ncbi:MAG: glycosyltransferase family 2 protein [Candidatus Dadabacteria bacterium]|nr:glycosyltransferase family 2 protein [Candidatus Dadabacteria bacterium]
MIKLSIIIPTLNEAGYIGRTLTSILEYNFYEKKPEIILVDSGSSDKTVELAKPYVDKVIVLKTKTSGKWEALNTGAEASSGQILLFLDADTILPKDYDKEIETALSHNGIIGGAFEFALDGAEFGLRVVELINRIRYRIRHSFYGDQGVFVTRDMFFKAGMFPKRRLFETSELCKRLRRYGKLKLINKHALTSPRRFIDGGIYRVLLNDTKLWFLNNLGLLPDDKKADVYWEENVNRGKRIN